MKTLSVFTQLFFLFIIQYNSIAQTPLPMHANTSVEIIRYVIPADKAVAFEEAYGKAAALLQQSPYCLGYEIIHGVEEPQHYIVRIHWTSKDDHLNLFRKSATFGSFFGLVKPFYENIQEMKHYTTTQTVWTRE